jgi:hypothetical protein
MIFSRYKPTDMVVYNSSYLEKWKLLGYKFILVLPLDKYGVLRPLMYEKDVNKGFTIRLCEVDLLQITEDYFFAMEKDVKIPVSS